MASKSKKRRRVLGASCILAALIIAGSSFAWFTSKDEVTNRLSANADYGVKIVESFAPTPNWLPSEEVNKDVYAVNTGTIGAFVKETVSSVVTITREKRFDDTASPFPVRDTYVYTAADETANAAHVAGTPRQTLEAYNTLVDDWFKANRDNLVQLTEGERYSVEAGSYLALMPETSTTTKSRNEVGRQVVSFNDAKNIRLNEYTPNTLKTDFAPDVDGLYVFRRLINVNTGDSQNYGSDSFKYRTEDFEYEAYYFCDGNYYKVELKSITEDDVRDLAGDNVDTDGNLTAATFGFYTVETTVETPTLAYDASKNELLATIKGYDADVTSIDTLASTLDSKEMAYEQALLELYERAKNLEGLTDLEKQKALDYAQKLIDEDNAWKKYENEKNNYEALKAQATTVGSLYSTKTTDRTVANNALYGNKKYYPAVVSGDYTPDTTYATDGTEPTYAQLTDSSDTNYIANWTVSATVEAKLGTSGAYKAYMIAKHNYETMPDHTSEEAFRTALKTFAVSEGKTVADSDTIESIAEMLSLAQLETFTNNIAATNPEWANYTNLMKTKKAYDKAVADYKAVQNQVDTLKTQKEQVEAGRAASWNKLYGTAEPGSPTHPTPSKATIDAMTTTSDPTIASLKGTAPHTGGYWAAYIDAADARATAKKDFDDAYNNAEGTPASGGTSGKAQYEAALTDLNNKKSELDNARMQYETAKEDYGKNGDILIHIKLSDDVVAGGEYSSNAYVADKWQMLPVKTLTDTLPNNEAVFYYTSVLDGGRTSAKLIDSVTLDSSVTQYMYKNFDFDLNVDLDSVQVAYDANGALKVDPANAEFAPTATKSGATVSISDPLSDDPILMWTGVAATQTNGTKFDAKVTGGNDVEIAYSTTGKTIGGVTYNYKITSGGADYYGNSINAGTEYKKVTGDDWATGADAATLTLTTDGVVKE